MRRRIERNWRNKFRFKRVKITGDATGILRITLERTYELK
jgi:hypothetical protein